MRGLGITIVRVPIIIFIFRRGRMKRKAYSITFLLQTIIFKARCARYTARLEAQSLERYLPRSWLMRETRERKRASRDFSAKMMGRVNTVNVKGRTKLDLSFRTFTW